MGVQDPILNCRVPQPVKDALHLLATRKQGQPGPLMRQWVTERLLVEAALGCLKAWGFEETLRRLAQPSPVVSQHSTEVEPERGEQTSENLVNAGKTR